MTSKFICSLYLLHAREEHIQLDRSSSSLSTGLNSMAAVVLEDFVKPFIKTSFTPKAADIFMKLTVVVLGAICVALVFVVEKTGTHVLQVNIRCIGCEYYNPTIVFFFVYPLNYCLLYVIVTAIHTSVRHHQRTVSRHLQHGYAVTVD